MASLGQRGKTKKNKKTRINKTMPRGLIATIFAFFKYYFTLWSPKVKAKVGGIKLVDEVGGIWEKIKMILYPQFLYLE